MPIDNHAVLRVYEHQLLRVGDRVGALSFTEQHFESLVRFATQRGERFFSIGHKSVRLRQYVGVISTDSCTLEILPKIDAHIGEPAWQQVLIDMLHACRFLRPEALGDSLLELRQGHLLDWYLDTFFAELEGLLRRGLLHAYNRTKQNGNVLKGQLKFAEQIKHNYIRQDRFFVSFDQYSDRHRANLLIGAALQLLERLPMAPERLLRLRRLRAAFPAPGPAHSLWHTEDAPAFDRKLERYHYALLIARHIIRHQQPDVRAGRQHGLALLFDMNLLFEEFIYQQLRQWLPKGVTLERQQSLVFWEGNRLRPDLVVQSPEGRLVIDTKWRVLAAGKPTADELRQIYVYCDYFGADTGVLLYPMAGRQNKQQTRAFAPVPGRAGMRYCRVQFASVFDNNGRLNREIGRDLLQTWETL